MPCLHVNSCGDVRVFLYKNRLSKGGIRSFPLSFKIIAVSEGAEPETQRQLRSLFKLCLCTAEKTKASGVMVSPDGCSVSLSQHRTMDEQVTTDRNGRRTANGAINQG